MIELRLFIGQSRANVRSLSLGGTTGTPISPALSKQSGCASDNWYSETAHWWACVRGHVLAPRGSGEFEHAVSIDVSTCSSHDTISRLDSTHTRPRRSFPRVMGCTGCTVPINLRATLGCTAALGITPAGHSPSSSPLGTYHSVEELLGL